MNPDLVKQVYDDIDAVAVLAGMSETKEFVALRKSFDALMQSVIEGCHD